MEELYKLPHLLNNVLVISKKYEDIAKVTGENFNIFSVMNMEWDEVYTHSAIIGELLNPKGSHDQGDTFLSLFISVLNETFKEKEDDFYIEKFYELTNDKICERTISEVNLIKGIGGRIDIILEDKNQIIIIENKPGYQDQPLQLIRYSNYAIKKGKPFKVFYLTMDGRNLQEVENHIETENLIEIKGFNFHYSDKEKYDLHQLIIEDKTKSYKCIYYPISFSKEIVNWLEKCHKVSIEQPILRETIKQYLNLVKKLTNQTINDVMSEEIVNTMKKSTKESFDVANNIWKLKETLYFNFMKLIKDFAHSKEMNVNQKNLNVDKEYGLYLTPKSWENKKINICIIFENSNYKGLYYGVSYEPELNDFDKSEVRKKFKISGFEESDWWIWKYSVNRDWHDNGEIWEDIAKGVESDTYKEITQGITEIIKIEKINFED